MDLIIEFFEFKKQYLLEYSSLLLGNNYNSNKEKYLKKYINNFVESYYFENYETIDYKDRSILTLKDVTLELQGKYHEMCYELDNNKKIKDEEKEKLKKEMMECYKASLSSIVIDLGKYNKCEVIADYEKVIRKILDYNKEYKNVSKDIFEQLARLVKKNQKAINDYLKNCKASDFFLNYDNYREQPDKYITKLHFKINQISQNYKNLVVDKVFNSKEVYEQKLIMKINLISVMLLTKLLNGENLENYFLEIPIKYMDTKEQYVKITKYCNNPLFKKHVIFILNYKNYNNKKSFFKEYENFKYALLIDLSRVIDINKKIEELEELKIFNYIIVDNVKDEDRRLVTEIELPGKEIFLNRYEFESKDV